MPGRPSPVPSWQITPQCGEPFAPLGDHRPGEQLDWQVVIRLVAHCCTRTRRRGRRAAPADDLQRPLPGLPVGGEEGGRPGQCRSRRRPPQGKPDAAARLEKANATWDNAITVIDEARKEQAQAPGLQEPARKRPPPWTADGTGSPPAAITRWRAFSQDFRIRTPDLPQHDPEGVPGCGPPGR